MPTLLAVPPHFARKLQHPPVYIFGKTTEQAKMNSSTRGANRPSLLWIHRQIVVEKDVQKLINMIAQSREIGD
jgi:hypothetical protein